MDPELSSAPDESESSSKKRLVVNELGNFCKKMSRGLESALEGENGAEVERLAQEVKVSQRLRGKQFSHQTNKEFMGGLLTYILLLGWLADILQYYPKFTVHMYFAGQERGQRLLRSRVKSPNL